MPELPEVETVARTLSQQIKGSQIASVHILSEKVLQVGKPLVPLLKETRVISVLRRAKLLLICLSEDKYLDRHNSQIIAPKNTFSLPQNTSFFLVFHLKMTGRFFVYSPETIAGKYTKMIFDLKNVTNVATGIDQSNDTSNTSGRIFFDDIRTFGYCRIMRMQDFSNWPFWTSLGPEPLETSSEELAERFIVKNSTIKSCLLDQRVIAGIGNIYADEALFRSGILPNANTRAIPIKKRIELAEALKSVLEQSINECGSSIRDYRDAFGNAGAFQNNFFVYGRKGEACRNCSGVLDSSKVAGRTTVFCRNCQK